MSTVNPDFLQLPPDPPVKTSRDYWKLGKEDMRFLDITPEQEAREDEDIKVREAMALLARHNIQVKLPGDLSSTPLMEDDPHFCALPAAEQTFFRVLEKTGRIRRASEVSGVGLSKMYHLRDTSPVYKRLWEESLAHRAELFEDEAIRRAVDGVRKEIYYRGEVVGDERVHSDSLLTKLLEANMPETYRTNYKVELEGKMAVATLVLPATTSVEEWVAQNEGNIIDVQPEESHE